MGTLVSFAALVIAALLALPAGFLLTATLGWWAHPWIGPAIAFVIFFLIGNAMLGGVLAVLSLSGGGLWSMSPVRWVIGKLAYLARLVPAFVLAMLVFSAVGLGWNWLFLAMLHPFELFGEDWPYADLPPGWHVLRFTVFMLAAFAIQGTMRMEKPVFAHATLPFRRAWRAIKTGLGGSASFDGLLDEWLMPWKPGQVILGTSLYEPGQRLGKTDDRHLLTIATTRSGKGRACIIPNLLTWPGSVLVIDPKGENAAITAKARRRMGQEIHILDPFRLLAQLGLDPDDYPVQRFNPLSAIGVNDLDVVEQIGNLADALIIHSEHGNPFWDNAAKAVLVGIIAHVLAWPKLEESERHLGTVRDYIAETNGRKLTDMAGHAGVANLTAVAVAELKRASDSAGGDILTTLAVHVKWLDSLAMRQALAASDFDLMALKQKKATLYLVIPPDYQAQHARFLRLFITLALRAAGRGVKAEHPMLFIMDEFATLGPLKVVEEAAGLLAGSGVRLWPIIQNLTQLSPYGDNREVFLANAGQIQVFAVNDQETARYFSERMGHHMAWRKVNTGGKVEWVPQGATWFRTSAELARESSRDSGRAIVFYEGGNQALVRRPAYDLIFDSADFELNPYQPGRRKKGWWSLYGEAIRKERGVSFVVDEVLDQIDRRFGQPAAPPAPVFAAQSAAPVRPMPDPTPSPSPATANVTPSAGQGITLPFLVTEHGAASKEPDSVKGSADLDPEEIRATRAKLNDVKAAIEQTSPDERAILAPRVAALEALLVANEEALAKKEVAEVRASSRKSDAPRMTRDECLAKAAEGLTTWEQAWQTAMRDQLRAGRPPSAGDQIRP
jgi:type IV secretory pathway TraG/TraD family ATPase VirD4